MATAFIPTFASVSVINASGTSASKTLLGSCPQVRLRNKGTVEIFVIWGKGAQTATASHMGIGPGVTESFTKQDADTIAVITGGTAADLEITCGTGD